MPGSGTLEDPYIIYDVDDLQAVSTNLAAYYELANDIDASATSGWNGGDGFAPIGPSFTGHFDGKKHTITDLYIHRVSEVNVGLFGAISDAVTIDDLYLEDCHIEGGYYVGGLAGAAWAGGVTGCAVINGYVRAAGNAGEYDYIAFVGGLFAENNAQISQCYSSGQVLANNPLNKYLYAGGLVGRHNSGPISDSFSRATLTASGSRTSAGGFLGRQIDAHVYRSYSTGSITGAVLKGGFCHLASAPANIIGCFWDTESSGIATSAAGTGKTTAQMKTKSTFTDAGWDFSTVWGMLSAVNDGYPYLRRVTSVPLRGGGSMAAKMLAAGLL